MEREQYICPVTGLKDRAAPKTENGSKIRVGLEAAHILPSSIGDTKVHGGVCRFARCDVVN